MHELNTNSSIAPLTVQFVPLKVVTKGAPWQKWASKYKSTGGGIPILYVVRADGRQLYGKSGGKSGTELATFMAEHLRQSGRIFSNRETALLKNAVAAAKEAIGNDNTLTAVNHIGTLSKLGPLGNLGSYGSLALEADALAKTLIEQGSRAIDDAVAKLDDAATRFDGALALADTQFVYAPLPELNRKVKSAYREANGDGEKKLALQQADAIRRGLARLKLRRGKKLAVRDLTRVVERYPDTPAAEVAARHIAEISGDAAVKTHKSEPTVSGKGPAQGTATEPTADVKKDRYRTWTDATGKHQVQAKWIATKDGSVQLETKTGRKISLKLEKLSDADQAWLQRTASGDEE